MFTISEPCKTPASKLSDFIADLISYGGPIPPAALSAKLKAADLTLADIKDWVQFDSEVYARNRIAISSNVEVIAMCWCSGQLTPIHDHRGSACAVRVMSGVATEIVYEHAPSGVLFPTSAAHIGSGSVVASFDSDMHQVGNLQGPDMPLVTLHCYSPPLKDMEMHDPSRAFFADYERTFKRCMNRSNSAVGEVISDAA